jgi:hypothetical protein
MDKIQEGWIAGWNFTTRDVFFLTDAWATAKKSFQNGDACCRNWQAVSYWEDHSSFVPTAATGYGLFRKNLNGMGWVLILIEILT